MTRIFTYIFLLICLTVGIPMAALPASADTPPAASDIRQMLALASAKNQRVEVRFQMTVVYRQDKYVYVTDRNGGATLLYGENNYNAGNIIPAGWTAVCTPVNGRTQYSGIFPVSTANGPYTIPTLTTVTPEDVNRVIKLSGVSFYEKTPPSPKQHFTGLMPNGEQLNFTNFFSLEPMTAGVYNLTVAVSLNDGLPELYPLEYKITGALLDRVEPPVFSPANHTFTDYVMVSITSPTPGANIYYTIDGPAPDDSSDVYTHQIKVMSTCVIKAIACSPGMIPSEVIESYYIESHEAPPQNRERIALFNFTEEESLKSMGAETPEFGSTEPVQNTVLYSDFVGLVCREADGEENPEIVNGPNGLSLSLKRGNKLTFSTMKSSKYVFGIRQITFITETPGYILFNNLPLSDGVWSSELPGGDTHTLSFDMTDDLNIDVIEVVYSQTTGMTSPMPDDEDEKERYFTISGIEVSGPGKGIYIVKKGHKVGKYMPKIH